MRFAFSTIGCPELEWEKVQALATRFGFREVELRALGGNLQLPTYFKNRGGVKTCEVGVAILASSFQLCANNRSSRSELEAWAILAEEFCCPWIRVFGNAGQMGGAMTREGWASAVETLRWWSELRRERGWGVDLIVETHDVFSSSQSCLELMHRSEKGVPVLWDLQHTCGTTEEDPESTWERLGKYVRHVHVSDRSALGNAWTFALPGEGVLPVKRVLNFLEREGFPGAVCLEWEKLWHPELASLEEALEKADKAWFSHVGKRDAST